MEGFYERLFFWCRGKSGGTPAFPETNDEEKAEEEDGEAAYYTAGYGAR